VQGLSLLVATITSAQKMVANKSATASSYSAQFGSTNISANYSTSDVNITIGTPAVSETQRLTIKAFDSRSNNTSIFQDITVVPYAAPIVNATVTRAGGFEPQTTLAISGTFSLVQVGGVTKNAISTTSGVKYRYKRSDTSTWGAWTNATATISGANISVANILMNCDNQYQWDFEVSITDKFQTTTAPLLLSVGLPILHINKNRKVGVNKIAENGDLDVAGDIYCNGRRFDGCKYAVGDVCITTNSANPSTIYPNTTWVAFGTGRTIVGVDTSDSDFNTVEKTGGSKTVTLTTSQMPSHNHRPSGATYVRGFGNAGSSSGYASGSQGGLHENEIVDAGGGQSHNNMPPFITAYFWKRTA
jgi:hypothetical protein